MRSVRGALYGRRRFSLGKTFQTLARSGSTVRRGLRRLIALVAAFTQIALLIVTVGARPAAASTVCPPQPGKDGSPASLSGVYNSYYDPPVGTLAAGSVSVPLGAIDTTGGGSATTVTTNDELLIIQMQDGTFNTSNSAAYGSGGATGSGYTSLSSAGLYEYVYVTGVSAGVASIIGAGSGDGLINAYHKAAATGSTGQQTYQIVRVPQYLTTTLTSNFRAAYWDGRTGGVAALDLASTLNLGGASIYATGDGFRGGGLTVASTTPASVLNTDWANSALMNGAGTAPGQGSKGEGIMGTPDYIFNYTAYTTPSAPSSPTVTNGTTDGYPGGDQARGAPGNAGGGGTDDDPASNDQNTGGGGGGNGGPGGNGGYPWTPSYSGSTPQFSTLGVHAATGQNTTNSGDIGGRGGAALTPSISRVFMGGGGGAGSNNNASNDGNTGRNPTGQFGSSGGVGGGIVMLRLAQASSSATIYANGTSGAAPINDGGGGGGAGGTVIVTSPYAFSGLTTNVNGAAGTSANYTASPATQQHGPGGGGGGGAVFASSAVTASFAGGAAGITTQPVSPTDTYGATAGTGGTSQVVSASQVPGVASGGECYATTNLTNGPILNAGASGSFDGIVTASINSDFTARAFYPGNLMTNSSTVLGSPTGNVLAGGPTTVNVPNEFTYTKSAGATQAIALNGVAPSAPAGWTVRICPDNGLGGASDGPTTNCVTAANWTAIGAAGATAQSVYTVPNATTNTTVRYWSVYSAPVNTVAYTRYDGAVSVTDNKGNSNVTHNELYAGFVVLTKNVTVVSSGCLAGQAPAGSLCPGGVVLYAIDYRNIVVGGASEAALSPTPLLMTSAGTLAIREPGCSGTGGTTGCTGTTDWNTYTTGLKEALVAGANGTTTFGDSTAGSTFSIVPGAAAPSGNAIGSLSFADVVGGASFQLVPVGVTGTNQGTLTFRLTMK